MKRHKRLCVLCATVALCASAMAQDAKPKHAVLITNARIFDGKNERLAEGTSVLVEGNTITKIAKSIAPPTGATVIDAAGRTMTPGFIDSHAHIMFQMSVGEAANADLLYFGYVATQTAIGSPSPARGRRHDGRISAPQLQPIRMTSRTDRHSRGAIRSLMSLR